MTLAYGRPGEACYYCQDDDAWSCRENNLTLPMSKMGRAVQVDPS